jgi:hypothetical protein
MRKNTLFGAIGLGVVGIFLSAGIANAGQQNELIVVGGNTVKPGQQIEFTGICNDRPWVKAQVRSAVLEDGIVALWDHPDNKNIIAGGAKVKKNAEGGTHTASFVCGNTTVSTKLTVVSANKPVTSKPTTGKPTPTKAKEAGAGRRWRRCVPAAPSFTHLKIKIEKSGNFR